MSFSNPSSALQYAVYQNLSQDYNVYDGTVFDGAYPHIILGEEFRNDDNPKNSARLSNHHLTLNVWSDYNGMKEVKDIGSDVIERLTYGLVLPEPFKLVRSRLFNVRYLKDDNGANDVYRALIQLHFEIYKTI